MPILGCLPGYPGRPFIGRIFLSPSQTRAQGPPWAGPHTHSWPFSSRYVSFRDWVLCLLKWAQGAGAASQCSALPRGVHVHTLHVGSTPVPGPGLGPAAAPEALLGSLRGNATPLSGRNRMGPSWVRTLPRPPDPPGPRSLQVHLTDENTEVTLGPRTCA